MIVTDSIRGTEERYLDFYYKSIDININGCSDVHFGMDFIAKLNSILNAWSYKILQLQR